MHVVLSALATSIVKNAAKANEKDTSSFRRLKATAIDVIYLHNAEKNSWTMQWVTQEKLMAVMKMT